MISSIEFNCSPSRRVVFGIALGCFFGLVASFALHEIYQDVKFAYRTVPAQFGQPTHSETTVRPGQVVDVIVPAFFTKRCPGTVRRYWEYDGTGVPAVAAEDGTAVGALKAPLNEWIDVPIKVRVPDSLPNGEYRYAPVVFYRCEEDTPVPVVVPPVSFRVER